MDPKEWQRSRRPCDQHVAKKKKGPNEKGGRMKEGGEKMDFLGEDKKLGLLSLCYRLLSTEEDEWV